MAALEPGQKYVAAFTPCRSAVTQIGSPPYHRASPVFSSFAVRKRAWNAGSHIWFPTSPLRPGRRPGAMEEWLGKVLEGKVGTSAAARAPSRAIRARAGSRHRSG